MYDVFCYGMISPSTVYVLDQRFNYPEPNQYAEIGQTLPSIGGEAVNSAIVLSKLGLTIKLDGCWMDVQKSGRIMDQLKPYEIDTSRITIKKECGTEELIITDRNSRTVFGNYAAFHAGERQWNIANEEDIISCRMVALDPYFKVESLDAAKLCVKNKIPYVTLDSRYDDYIAVNAAAVIISHELRDQAYPDADMDDLFERYRDNCNGLIIFTFGSDELWYARRGMKTFKYTPYKITPIDTTGAGDSFRAGIIYGLLNSFDDHKTVDFASAVAASVCLTTPHALNCPDLEGIKKFMKEYKRG